MRICHVDFVDMTAGGFRVQMLYVRINKPSTNLPYNDYQYKFWV